MFEVSELDKRRVCVNTNFTVNKQIVKGGGGTGKKIRE